MSVRHFSRRIPAFVVLLALYLAPWPVSIPVAGAADEKPDSVAYDVRAGKSSLKKLGGERVLELSDRVHIVHGDIVITSNTGLHYNKRRHTFLLGDVVVKQEGMTMWGDEGEYIKSRESAILRGNVRIENEGWVLTADEVEYSRETRHAWLRGNVVARDSHQHSRPTLSSTTATVRSPKRSVMSLCRAATRASSRQETTASTTEEPAKACSTGIHGCSSTHKPTSRSEW